MSKAVTGAVEIGVGAVLVATGVGAAFGASLIMMGAGEELSALADMLQGQRGQAQTLRQAAAPRRVIYGTQRVGAIEVYESTTGSSKDQYNMVLVYSAEEVTNFLNLYLDGRQVYWAGSGAGWTVRNGIGFGGGADGNNHTGPDGSTYNFANANSGHRGVWAEVRFGDQPTGDYSTSLQNNDSTWGPTALGTPSLMGCAYMYLKCEYNSDDFPQKPDARCTIKGKAVFDPRTGVTAYSENAALIMADVITNSEYGLGDTVNTAQLIAAANICDEQSGFLGAGGGVESRYTCHYTWSLDKGVGDVLNDMLTGMAGRISYIEGEWYIFPGTYVGPSATFSSANLLGKPNWSSQRRYREKVNRVQGTYIAPNYPYSVAGDEYDNNGWYNGTTQNNFPYAFQPDSYPTFACDVLHGYASDQFLNEDLGNELPLSVDFASVLSITQAQRLAKIMLLRNRQQGSGTLLMGPEALILQPNDTFLFTFPQRGWADKLLEVAKMDISIVPNEDGVPQIQVLLTVNETEPTVYVWLPTDELTPYEVEALPSSENYITAPPTNVVAQSSAATALVQPDGTVIPRIEVTWDTPADVRVTSIQFQYQLTGATTWSDAGSASVTSNLFFIPAISGQEYDIRIRSLQANGGASVWVELDGIVAGLVLSIIQQDGYGLGTLIGEAYSGGTAAIECTPFTAYIGQLALPIFPSGLVTITNDGTIGGAAAALQQLTLYYVYYIDPTYVGGNVSPIATTNKTDYLGKLGYFLIDSIITPYNGGSSAGMRYYPSTYVDSGSRSTSSPGNAYDGSSTSAAVVGASGVWNGTTETDTNGDCTWSGFASVYTTAAKTLTVRLSASMTFHSPSSSAGSIAVYMNISGVQTQIASVSATTAMASYTATIPSGTDLSGVSVEVTADPGFVSHVMGATSSTASGSVADIYVQ